MAIRVLYDGHCIVNATVQVVVDEQVVQSATQTMECGYWDDVELVFKYLPLADVTVRASAPGYATKEIVSSPLAQRVVDIDLQRAN